MKSSARAIAVAGAILSLTAVILAALGSHLIDMKGLHGSWQTASMIHLFNAAALMGLAALLVKVESRLLPWGAWLIVSGSIVFCGSLYLHVVTGQTLSGTAPAGGILMIAGWLLVVLALIRQP